jgi:hypothetical protein
LYCSNKLGIILTRKLLFGTFDLIFLGRLYRDALLSTSFQWVAQHTQKDKVDPARILDVVMRLGKSVGAKGLAGGQVMDLICEGKGADVTIDNLRWIHTHKTAALLDVAVSSGAILGGATSEKLCEEFALNIGLAFQVADDILDRAQSTEELGKTAGKDDAVDKSTYPKLEGLDGARAEVQRVVVEAKEALEPFGDRAICRSQLSRPENCRHTSHRGSCCHHRILRAWIDDDVTTVASAILSARPSTIDAFLVLVLDSGCRRSRLRQRQCKGRQNQRLRRPDYECRRGRLRR